MRHGIRPGHHALLNEVWSSAKRHDLCMVHVYFERATSRFASNKAVGLKKSIVEFECKIFLAQKSGKFGFFSNSKIISTNV